MISSLLLQTLFLATPLILAAMAGYTSERGGVINIALEGKMLIGACTAGLLAGGHGPVVAVIGAVIAATTFSLLHWLLTQHYQVDHVISGMAINALAAGLTNFLWGKLNDPSRLGQLPGLSLWLFVLPAVVSPFVLWWVSKNTRPGLRLLAVGSDPHKSRLAGLRPIKIRLGGLVLTGLFTGLAGAFLVANTGSFTDNMTAGRGFIALAALIIAGWRPIPALVSALVFGFFTALQLVVQGNDVFGVKIPTEVWTALPYVVTVVALAGFLGKNRTPAGLGKA